MPPDSDKHPELSRALGPFTPNFNPYGAFFGIQGFQSFVGKEDADPLARTDFGAS